MLKQHWEYYRTIEEDLARTFRFIEPRPDNVKTYSLELSRIILIAGSEADVVMKELCLLLDPSKKKSQLITLPSRFPVIDERLNDEFMTFECCIPRFDIVGLVPWRYWTHKDSPFWWTAYNKTKHDRGKSFEESNLNNAIFALAGLYVLLVFLQRERTPKAERNVFRIPGDLLFHPPVGQYAFEVSRRWFMPRIPQQKP